MRKEGIYANQKLNVYNKERGNIFRVINTYSRQEKTPTLEPLVIRSGADYSDKFKELLKDYYLYL